VKQTQIKAVVLPVDASFLSVLVDRRNSLTTLIWGWQGNSSRMAEPHRILREDQPHLPLLFSPMEQAAKQVTHVAVCGLLVHRNGITRAVEQWLDKRRVERFAGIQHGSEAASLYVVTAAKHLSRGVPYGDLLLAKGKALLSADKRRGYAVVHLPTTLQTWFEEACRQWDALSGELPATPRA